MWNVMIWVLLTVIVIQLLLLIERFVHTLVSIFVPQPDGDPVKKLARRGVLSSFFANLVLIITLPVQAVSVVIETFVSNLTTGVALFTIFCVLSIVARNPASFFAYFINTYNGGIGVMLNYIFVKPLEITSWCVVYLIPLYNSFTYWTKEVLRIIFFDVMQVNLGVFVDMIENIMLLFGSVGISLGTWSAHVAQCALHETDKVFMYGNASLGNVSSIPFTDPNMDCIGNDNFLLLDVMTPALYAQRLFGNVNEMIAQSCSPALLPVNIMLYPLLDYNIWMLFNSLFNGLVIHPIFALPLKTWRRCEYAHLKANSFTTTEKIVMCTPDFSVWIQLLKVAARHLGKITDNWLNVGLLLVESALGTGVKTCDGAPSIHSVWQDASAVLGDDLPLQTVGLTETLYAVTNGESTVYQSAVPNTLPAVAIGNWPFPIEPRYGVAAVQHAQKFDADDAGQRRTGMLGCRCLDGEDGLSLTCATVPYLTHHTTSDEEYEAETVIRIRFDPADANKHLTRCSAVRIKVSSMRFSRRRFSFGGDDGVDATHNDMYDVLGLSGQNGFAAEPQTFSADAAIVVTPLCSLASDNACLELISSCFPFCMGLHVAGTQATSITLHSAHYWKNFVNIAQTDCGVLQDAQESFCGGSLGAILTSTNWQFMVEGVCDLPAACIPADYMASALPLHTSPLQNAFRKTQPTIRLTGQPFVANGDVMLFAEAGQVHVVRLYDNSRGDFTLQNEALVLSESPDVLTTRLCMPADETCHEAAMLADALVLPPPDRLARQVSQAVAVSEWGVHWAVNPDTMVHGNYLDSCNERGGFGVTLADAYGPARVWTLKAFRASASGAAVGDEAGRVSYMTVPDWLSPQGDCRQAVNIQVTDLEYLNSQNILVTVLRAAPMDYDPATDQVCATCSYSYARYFLHPNLARCTNNGAQSGATTFSCWRAESSGMFQDAPVRAAVVQHRLGTLCPAVRRMPEIGALGAELAIASLTVLKIGLELVTVLPPVLATSGLADLFKTRLSIVTFHTALDSSGRRLIDVEPLIFSIDKAMFYVAASISKLGDLFASLRGYEYVKPQIIGTAKIVQHMSGEALMTGNLLGQLKAIEKMPSLSTINSMQGGVTGMTAKPSVLRSLRGLVASQLTSFSFNARVLRRMAVRTLRFMADTAVDLRTIASLFTSILYESFSDLDRSTLDGLRVQCDGLGNILHTDNPWARTVRNGCLLVPDGISAMYNIILIFVVEYPILSCACKIGSEGDFATVLEKTCMASIMPTQYRYILNNLRFSSSSEPRDFCIQFMDSTNTRLETAFDQMLGRLSRMTESIGESLNYLFSFTGISEEGCDDHIVSPYVMSIVPEPLAYFQGCALTSNCAIRCHSSMQAFERAKEYVIGLYDKPLYQANKQLTLESPFYDEGLMLGGFNIAPFEILTIRELHSRVCRVVCRGLMHEASKCVFVAGLEPDDPSHIDMAYYCVPAHYLASITRYELPTPPSKALMDTPRVVKTLHTLTTENVVKGLYEVLFFTAVDEEAEYHSAGVYLNGLYATLIEGHARSGHYPIARGITDLTTILDAFVIPSTDATQTAYVFLRGTMHTASDPHHVHCLRLGIDTAFYADGVPSTTWSPFQSVHTQVCSDDEATLVSSMHHIACLDHHCGQIMRLPHTVGYAIDVLSLTRPATYGDYFSITVSTTRSAEMAEGFASQFSRLYHADPTLALYRTEGGRAVKNLRRFSHMVRPLNGETWVTFDMFLCGGSSTDLTWLHSARVRLQSGKDTVAEVTNLEQAASVEIVLDCTVSNCIGCNTNPPQAQYLELQTLCFEAQSCALKNCIGTSVNMRKPLCNVGQVAAASLDTYRVSVRTLWKVVSRSIILAVEISESRRRVYEIGWLDEQFMEMSCQSKDVIIESVATLTSIVGMVSSISTATSDPWKQTARIDSTTNAHNVLIAAAATRLVANIALLPVLLGQAAWKVTSCNINATVLIVQGLLQQGKGDIVVQIGRQNLLPATEAAVGQCLVQEVDSKLMDLARETNDDQVTNFLKDEANNHVGSFLKHAASTQFSVMYHPVHAGLAWMLGVVTGVEDLLQTVDYRNCKAPVAFNDVSPCVCGDKAFRIPVARRAQKSNVKLWCTGPLLFKTAFGDDVLVINPFTLDEILAQASKQNDNYDDYLQCLSTSSLVEGACSPPDTLAHRYFANFGVDVLQVIARCRGNYNAKIWDPGAIAIGLFPYSDWQSGTLTLHPSMGASFQKMRRQMYVMAQQAYVSIFDLAPDRDTWLCLHTAGLYVNWNHNCHTEAIQRIPGIATLESFFKYEPVSEPSFSNSDACEVFSGNMPRSNAQNGATFSNILWSPGSPNNVGVADLHVKDASPKEARFAYVSAYLETYWRTKIRPLIAELASYDSPEDIDVDLWSEEGDLLHQTVDCVVMGPYASADLRSSFTMPNGRKFPVPQYHRGTPTTRDFHGDIATGGSQARIAVMHALQKEASEKARDVVRNEAREHVHFLRSFFLDETAFLCVCPDRVRRLACCEQSSWVDLSDITFASSDILAREWNLYDTVIPDLLKTALKHSALKEDIWASRDFVPSDPIPFTPDERVDMLHAYVFDVNKPIREYSLDEVDTVLGAGHTLWEDCTALLSAAFFSLPLSEGRVEADMYYDPTAEDSDSFLHGMEPVVANLVALAREKFPFFWTHAHRYVPTESTWCESNEVDTTSVDESNVFESGVIDDVFLTQDSMQGFPADTRRLYPAVLSCHCGWTDADQCLALPTGLSCLTVSTGLQTRWDALCNKKLYSSRDDWFLLLEVLEHPDTEETWKGLCRDNFPAIHWGLLDNAAKREWFEGGTSFHTHDFLDVLMTKGPGGLRYGLLGKEAFSMRTFFTEAPVIDKTHSRANFRYRHTVGQPVCDGGLAAWLEDDLRRHFVDVFVPMAHTHHDAAVSAYCTRWTVEYALLRAYEDAGVPSDVLAVQANRVADWRLRCDLQLQQISICLLRDVYSIVPAELPASDCAFSVAEDPECGALFYTTAACLVMCDGDFYDPCACGGVADCDSVVFSKSLCADKQIWDARPFGGAPEVLTSSLHWPDSIAANEGGTAELDDLVKRDRADGIPMEDFLMLMQELTADRMADTVEGAAPDAFCDDALDYWPADAQHPVGYHPTTCCARGDTNMRGFDAWMSQPHDAAEAYSIDPVRLRNLTQTSTEFGTAHEICDVSVYGNRRLHLNPFYFESRWDADDSADLHMPLVRTTRSDTAGMNTFGVNAAQDPFATPLMEGDPYLRHSAGLLRGYAKSPDSELQGMAADSWPIWTSDNTYGTFDTEACPLPALYECSEAVPCTSHPATPLTCKYNAAGVGLCVEAESCFMHEHCEGGFLCAGNGQCVAPEVLVLNELDTEFEVTLSGQSELCEEAQFGTSRFQGVSDFADANGLCNFRSWNRYLNRTHHTTTVDRALQTLSTSSADFSSVTSDSVLRQEAHPCDRSYDKLEDFGFCALPAKLSSGNEPARGHVLRTWDADNAFFCDMDRREYAITGFLSPYLDYGADNIPRDTLANTAANLRRCSDFAVCPQVAFSVDDLVVTRGRRVGARAYTNLDHESCGAVGYIYEESAEASAVRCAVDRATLPLLTLLFQVDITNELPVRERSDAMTSAELGRLLDRHRVYCPHAFNGDTDFEQAYLALAFSYGPPDVEGTTAHANRLLHQVFGEKRGFTDVDGYLDASRCAKYVLDQLDVIHDASFSQYYAENPQQPPKPGRSLYFFTLHTTTQTPFMWFWQCIVLATELQGGTRHNWLTSVDLDFVCPNYNQEPMPEPTMRQRLMRAPYLFDVKDSLAGGQEAVLFVAAVRAAIVYAIDSVGVANVEDTLCHGLYTEYQHPCLAVYPHVDGECGPGTSPDCILNERMHDILAVSGCPREVDVNQALTMVQNATLWIHAGRDVSMFVDQEDDPANSILGKLLSIIFGGNQMLASLSMTYQGLIDMDIISEGFDLEAVVPRNSVYFHGIRLNKLDQYQGQARPTTIRLEEGFVVPGQTTIKTTQLQEWARPDTTCEEYFDSEVVDRYFFFRSNVAEHSMRDVTSSELCDIDVQSVVTKEQALCLVIRVFRREVANIDILRMGNMHLVREMSTQQTHAYLTRAFSASAQTDALMRAKEFPCGEHSWNPADITNLHLRTLQECIRDKLTHETSTRLPAAETLRMYPNADILLKPFILAVAEPPHERFLSDFFFSDELAHARASLQICYEAGGQIRSINPFTATRFDIETGCDIRHSAGSTWAVDFACALMNGMSCRDVHPEYEAGRSTMPPFCAANSNAMFMRRNTGSLPDPPELCERRFSPPVECLARHATVFNSIGTPATDLHSLHVVEHTYAGVWSTASIQALFNKDVSVQTRAWRLLPTEIAGDAMLFALREDAEGRVRLDLECLFLGVHAQGCNRPADAWLRLIRERWAFQHHSLAQHWQDTDAPTWSCPLQWLAAASGVSRHSLTAPSHLRNTRRFAHITEPLSRAHPTMEQMNGGLDMLQAGAFMTEVELCAAGDADREACRGVDALGRARSWLRSANWHVVALSRPGNPCPAVLDWPSVPYRAFDGSKEQGVALPDTCNILERVPSFALRRRMRTLPRIRPATTSLDPGGVCHMGRLPRLHASPVVGNRGSIWDVHACRQHDELVLCQYKTQRDGKMSLEETMFQKQQPSPPVEPRPRRRRCAHCDDHTEASFIGGDLHKAKLPTTATKHLSAGKMTTIHPARQLAAQLRKSVCANTTGPCPALEVLLPPEDYTLAKFARSFFGRRPLAHTTNASQVDDSPLWTRDWVWCDKHNTSRPCVGHIPRSQWLNATERPRRCADAVFEAHQQKTAPIQFCKVDTQTSRLCQSIATWNADIKRALCLLNDLPDCPETSHFYVPSVFSISNNEFASQTVKDFYEYENREAYATQCAASAPTSESYAGWSNKDCLSIAVAPFRIVLEALSSVVLSIIQLAYYVCLWAVKLLELIIAALIQVDVKRTVQDFLTRAEVGFVVYSKLLVFQLRSIFGILANMLYELIMENEGFFRAMRDLTISLCRGVNSLVNIGYQVACPAANAYYKIISNVMFKAPIQFIIGDDNFELHIQQVSDFSSLCSDERYGFSIGTGCMQPDKCPGFIPKHEDDPPETPGCKLDPDPLLFGYHRCDCASLFPPPIPTPVENRPLPQPTRCWSTYSAFFGDTTPLSCQGQDTCQTQDRSDNVLCAECADSFDGFRDFGCDPVTKMCRCSVPVFRETNCFSNAECRAEGPATCRYIDVEAVTDVFSYASVPCGVCSGTTSCFVAPGREVGVCGCTLHNVPVATCPGSSHTHSVALPFSSLCLLGSSGALLSSNTYEVPFDELLSTTCSNANQAYCYRVTHGDGVVAFRPVAHVTVSRRRLLAVDARCQHSVVTIDTLGADLPECAFASLTDALGTAFSYDLSPILSNHTMLRVLLSRHTPLHGLIAAVENASRARRYRDNDHPGDLVVQILNPLMQPRVRRLHGMAEVLDSAQHRFEEMAQIHNSFADTIMSAFRTDYTPLSDGQAGAWVGQWPPRLVSEADGSCSVVPQIIQSFAYATANLTLFYTALGRGTLPARPPTPLRDSWPRLLSSQAVPEFTLQDRPREDILVQLSADAARAVLGALGIDERFVFDFTYSATNTIVDSFQCDLENVQMCYQWRVTIGNGLVVVFVMYTVAFLLCQAFGLSFVVLLLVPLFGFFILNLCYGYQWTCFPLIPTCLLNDLVSTLNETLPAKIEPLPRALLRTGGSFTRACAPQALASNNHVPAACIVQCSDAPQRFDSYAAPLAWLLEEIGMTRLFEDHVLPLLAFTDTADLQYHLHQKRYAMSSNDNLLLYRACAAITSYRLFPYILLASVAFALVLSVSRVFVTLLYALTNFVAAIFVEAFT